MRLWIRWTLAMLAGEALGFGFAGLVGWGATLAWGDGAFALLVIVVAGGVEGAIVGLAQSLVLPQVARARWMALTAGAALAAWTAGMLAGGRVPIDLLPILAPALLVAMGTLMGAAQWVELRRHAPRAGRWIVANAAAWPLGLLWVYGASAIVTETTPLGIGAALIVGSGLAMGVTVGVITGLVIERMTREHEPPRRGAAVPS